MQINQNFCFSFFFSPQATGKIFA